jgi:hypothetical protein
LARRRSADYPAGHYRRAVLSLHQRSLAEAELDWQGGVHLLYLALRCGAGTAAEIVTCRQPSGRLGGLRPCGAAHGCVFLQGYLGL